MDLPVLVSRILHQSEAAILCMWPKQPITFIPSEKTLHSVWDLIFKKEVQRRKCLKVLQRRRSRRNRRGKWSFDLWRKYPEEKAVKWSSFAGFPHDVTCNNGLRILKRMASEKTVLLKCSIVCIISRTQSIMLNVARTDNSIRTWAEMITANAHWTFLEYRRLWRPRVWSTRRRASKIGGGQTKGDDCGTVWERMDTQFRSLCFYSAPGLDIKSAVGKISK